MTKHITNIISMRFGKFASYQFSPAIQSFINRAYVSLLGLDMSEFRDPSTYKTLNELFTRGFEIPRAIDEDKKSVIAPADSLITALGKINKTELFQIKGMAYNFEEMLTVSFDEKKLEKVKNGSFINFYLSPKDYHRYHSPMDCTISKLIYVPAKLYPVNMRYLKNKLNLFIENERVMLECQDVRGKVFYMVFVGALNVGQMTINFEPQVQTNAKALKQMVFSYDNLPLSKGDEIGTFKMGSTVLMLFEKDFGKITTTINKKVKFGEKVLDITDN